MLASNAWMDWTMYLANVAVEWMWLLQNSIGTLVDAGETSRRQEDRRQRCR
eukprot:CAMPEP_0196595838 /NCGR_PEP_ID=MMETSP1081-20130531/82808_1 /TAXON_ID=36882 /ORGANISM="Pyramimonas amylifera, Strain CCMP720" /LENGTH=50 /DNA_ID=CAMNT_0041920599 /DNA_START=77 /DNA_END=226 /DNA_ORIENTATION=-